MQNVYMILEAMAIKVKNVWQAQLIVKVFQYRKLPLIFDLYVIIYCCCNWNLVVMTSHWPKKKDSKTKKVVKVNKQFIVDDQAKCKVCLLNQTPCWHTFYQNVMWGNWVQTFKLFLSSNWSFDLLYIVYLFTHL